MPRSDIVNTPRRPEEDNKFSLELELELIQYQMTQKPVLRCEVGESGDLRFGFCWAFFETAGSRGHEARFGRNKSKAALPWCPKGLEDQSQWHLTAQIPHSHQARVGSVPQYGTLSPADKT